jgi:hypothetical protein
MPFHDQFSLFHRARELLTFGRILCLFEQRFKACSQQRMIGRESEDFIYGHFADPFCDEAFSGRHGADGEPAARIFPEAASDVPLDTPRWDEEVRKSGGRLCCASWRTREARLRALPHRLEGVLIS